MWIFDEDTLAFLDVNPSAVRTYGYSRDEFLSMTLRDIRTPEDVPTLLASFQPQGEWGERLWRHTRKDGTALLVKIFSTPTEYGDRPARAVTVRDVTDQERRRQEIASTNMALNAILACSPACIISVDREARIETWNTAAARLSGKQLGDVRGSVLWRVLDLDSNEFLASFSRVLDGETVDGVELRVTEADSDRHLLFSASPVYGTDGRVESVIAVLLDVSDRVRARQDLEAWSELLERRVAERTTELSAANDELEGFCASVSHDLRSPLRAIDGFSRAVLEDHGDKMDDQGRDFLNRVRAASWRMSSLIDDLLGLTRLTRAPIKRGVVDLAALAQEVVTDLREASESRPFRFECMESAVVYGDQRLLRMLLVALLDNAWKFTSKGQDAFAKFTIDTRGNETVYVIQDNGVGFDMTYSGRLFRPFERLHKTTDFPGNGIGLATASRIIAKHGGRIWVESEMNRGTTICFTLDALGPMGNS